MDKLAPTTVATTLEIMGPFRPPLRLTATGVIVGNYDRPYLLAKDEEGREWARMLRRVWKSCEACPSAVARWRYREERARCDACVELYDHRGTRVTEIVRYGRTLHLYGEHEGESDDD